VLVVGEIGVSLVKRRIEVWVVVVGSVSIRIVHAIRNNFLLVWLIDKLWLLVWLIGKLWLICKVLLIGRLVLLYDLLGLAINLFLILIFYWLCYLLLRWLIWDFFLFAGVFELQRLFGRLIQCR